METEHHGGKCVCYISPLIWVTTYESILGCKEKWPTKESFSAAVWVAVVVNYVIPVTLLAITLLCNMLYIYTLIVKQNNLIASLNVASLRGVRDRNVRNAISVHRRNVKTFIVCVTLVVCYAVSGLPVQLRYVLYVALHEVYNFTSGLPLKYIYKISRA